MRYISLESTIQQVLPNIYSHVTNVPVKIESISITPKISLVSSSSQSPPPIGNNSEIYLCRFVVAILLTS